MLTGWRGTAGVALGAGLLWIAITVLTVAPIDGPTALQDLVTAGVGRQFVFASLFLVLVVLLFRWPDLGLAAPRRGWLKLVWLPLLYIALMLALALGLGLPPPRAMLFVALNCLLVGFSEELMFRGILWSGLRRPMGFWPAVWTVTAIFGVIHVLNAFTTGALSTAAIQAVAAGMSGLLYLAIRIRSGSVILCMVLHAVWDFVTFLVTLGSSPEGADPAAVAALPLGVQLLPLAFVAPLFLCGLYLLRRSARDRMGEA